MYFGPVEFKKNNLYVCLCAQVSACVACTRRSLRRPEKALDTTNLGLQVAVNSHMGAGNSTSARVVSTLNLSHGSSSKDFIFILFVCVTCMYACIHVYSASRVQKRAFDHLELKLQISVEYHQIVCQGGVEAGDTVPNCPL